MPIASQHNPLRFLPSDRSARRMSKRLVEPRLTLTNIEVCHESNGHHPRSDRGRNAMTPAEPYFRARADARREIRDLPPVPPGNTFLRFVTAQAVACLTRTSPLQVAERLWPSDKSIALLLMRAAAEP